MSVPVSTYLPIVRHCMLRYAARFPSADRDALESDGQLALLNAIKTHDPARGRLETYIKICVFRAMASTLRKQQRYRVRNRRLSTDNIPS